jgi:hypothetical protein
MTTAPGAATGDPNVIRPPTAARIYVAVFTCFWGSGVLTFGIVAAVHHSPAVVISLLMLAFGLTLGYQIFRLSVTLNPDDLLVRNYYRTRRVPRADIEGFRVGSLSGQPFGRTVYLLLRDGAVLPLDAAGRMPLSGRGKAAMQDRLRSLQHWLDQQ